MRAKILDFAMKYAGFYVILCREIAESFELCIEIAESCELCGKVANDAIYVKGCKICGVLCDFMR